LGLHLEKGEPSLAVFPALDLKGKPSCAVFRALDLKGKPSCAVFHPLDLKAAFLADAGEPTHTQQQTRHLLTGRGGAGVR
jgi:hypothetical protein